MSLVPQEHTSLKESANLAEQEHSLTNLGLCLVISVGQDLIVLKGQCSVKTALLDNIKTKPAKHSVRIVLLDTTDQMLLLQAASSALPVPSTPSKDSLLVRSALLAQSLQWKVS